MTGGQAVGIALRLSNSGTHVGVLARAAVALINPASPESTVTAPAQLHHAMGHDRSQVAAEDHNAGRQRRARCSATARRTSLNEPVNTVKHLVPCGRKAVVDVGIGFEGMAFCHWRR